MIFMGCTVREQHEDYDSLEPVWSGGEGLTSYQHAERIEREPSWADAEGTTYRGPLTARQRERMREMIRAGVSPTKAAAELGVSKTTYWNIRWEMEGRKR